MLQDRVARAKELLKTVRHAAMATVNEDGSPHNTPYFFACSADVRRLFWRSLPDTLHSGNIERTGQLFVVLYHAAENSDGLYLQATRGRQATPGELDEVIMRFNTARKAANMPVIDPEIYKEALPKFYVADVEKVWINDADVDADGVISRDYRREINIAELAEQPQ